MKTKHYARLQHHAFGPGRTLRAPGSWDQLRLNGRHDTAYAIPHGRSAWIDRCAQDQPIVERAAAIVDLIRSLDVRRVFSAGVGRACLEYNIKRIDPSLHLVCSDFAPRTVEALRQNFGECDDMRLFDIRDDDWPQDVDMHLLYRVDTELDDSEWRSTFEAMRRAEVRYVLFVPAQPLSLPVWLREVAKGLLYRARDKRFTFAGYMRTTDHIKTLWLEKYVVKQQVLLGGLEGFLLERIPSRDKFPPNTA